VWSRRVVEALNSKGIDEPQAPMVVARSAAGPPAMNVVLLGDLCLERPNSIDPVNGPNGHVHSTGRGPSKAHYGCLELRGNGLLTK
jgi:hypothetical protein